MLDKWQFFLLSGLGTVALALAMTTIVLFNGNRSAQDAFTTRAQYIKQSQQLEPVYQGLIRGLAELSVKRSDAQLGELLSSQGITFSAKLQEANP